MTDPRGVVQTTALVLPPRRRRAEVTSVPAGRRLVARALVLRGVVPNEEDRVLMMGCLESEHCDLLGEESHRASLGWVGRGLARNRVGLPEAAVEVDTEVPAAMRVELERSRLTDLRFIRIWPIETGARTGRPS